jgi:hypothetical protein
VSSYPLGLKYFQTELRLDFLTYKATCDRDSKSVKQKLKKSGFKEHTYYQGQGAPLDLTRENKRHIEMSQRVQNSLTVNPRGTVTDASCNTFNAG